ncbi:MAG: hypothetical protein U0K66_04615 [Paludibacteraceae bacterium]|jgi:hypothetical protein|nr:hypothetical protein [Paludibacteraceae bacterium]
MKKLLLLAVMLIVSMSVFSRTCIETVYLKNGSIIKGVIVEYQPEKSVKILTADNSVFVCNVGDIEKVTREPIDVVSTKGYLAPQKGYRFFLAADQMVGDMTGFKFTTTHGAQFNNKIFLGGGVGFCVADDDVEFYLSIPVYANFRFDILNKKTTPFIEARAGVAFAIEGTTGFYGNISVGGRFKRFSLSTGVETLQGTEDYFRYEYDTDYVYSSWNYVDCPEPYRAFSFVTRFAFEF